MFASLAGRHGGRLSRAQAVALMASMGLGEGGERAELLWSEMGLGPTRISPRRAAPPLLCSRRRCALADSPLEAAGGLGAADGAVHAPKRGAPSQYVCGGSVHARAAVPRAAAPDEQALSEVRSQASATPYGPSLGRGIMLA